MLSINQIIQANEKTYGSPYFYIDSNQEGFSNIAVVVNSLKSSDLMTPDAASRAFIQQLSNLACHINLMEISLNLTAVYEGVFSFRKSLRFAKLINSILGSCPSLNQKALNALVANSGLTSVDSGIREATTLILKIEDHLQELGRIIAAQVVGTNELAVKYKSDCMKRTILCNNLISKSLGGVPLNNDELELLNNATAMQDFGAHLESFTKMYHDFYDGIEAHIEVANSAIKEISVNFDSIIDVIDDSANSPVKGLSLLPTDSFEADISTLVRKSMNGESPLIVLSSVLEKHIIFISDANSELIDVANSIDQQVNYFGSEVRANIQPHVTCDLVKVTAESMLNTQRKYEYNPEN